MLINQLNAKPVQANAEGNTNTQSDIVYIEGLTVKAVIGLYEWERMIEQPIIWDIAMYTDIKPVAESNCLQTGVNYKAVCDDVTHWSKSLQCHLVEELAETVASRLLEKYAIHMVTLKIGKPIAITEAKLVGVQITRYK